MLIEFAVSNYRSFRDRQTFSMVASKFGEHEKNTFESGLRSFPPLLRSSAIYGPNAAGKTNLVRSLQYVKHMVMQSATTTLAVPYRHVPFKFSSHTRSAPSEFVTTFIQEGTRYEYGFALDAERICKEWLIEYKHAKGRDIFLREYDQKASEFKWKFSSFFKGQRTLWRDSTRPNALFLSTAANLNSEQLLPVFKWFQSKLQVIVGQISLNQTLTLKLLREPKGKEQLLPFLREADLGIADIQIDRQNLSSEPVFVKAAGGVMIDPSPDGQSADAVKVRFTHHSDDPSEQAQLDFDEESSGTQEFFKSAGAWLNVMANGEVVVVDEIDRSLHPLLARFLVEKFHSNEANPHNAQLIFNTHNTSLLDREIFRRDQIWFAEKDKNGASKIYPLTDFSPRNDEALEKGYLRGRYGALPVLGER